MKIPPKAFILFSMLAFILISCSQTPTDWEYQRVKGNVKTMTLIEQKAIQDYGKWEPGPLNNWIKKIYFDKNGFIEQVEFLNSEMELTYRTIPEIMGNGNLAYVKYDKDNEISGIQEFTVRKKNLVGYHYYESWDSPTEYINHVNLKNFLEYKAIDTIYSKPNASVVIVKEIKYKLEDDLVVEFVQKLVEHSKDTVTDDDIVKVKLEILEKDSIGNWTFLRQTNYFGLDERRDENFIFLTREFEYYED
jgi:hypothetical protein